MNKSRDGYDWELGRLEVNRKAAFVGARGKSDKPALYAAPVYWRPGEVEFLRQTYGRSPLSEVARALGRTPSAVNHAAERLGIPPAQSRTDVWTVNQLANAFGVWDNSARLMWLRGEIPTVTMYAGELPVRMVFKMQMLQFAGNPLNWYALPKPCKWAHPELRRVRDIALATWGDRWVTASEAGQMLTVAPAYLKRLIGQGELPNSRSSGGRWFMLRSDLEALARKRGWRCER